VYSDGRFIARQRFRFPASFDPFHNMRSVPRDA
jgi:hypothetical protein